MISQKRVAAYIFDLYLSNPIIHTPHLVFFDFWTQHYCTCINIIIIIAILFLNSWSYQYKPVNNTDVVCLQCLWRLLARCCCCVKYVVQAVKLRCTSRSRKGYPVGSLLPQFIWNNKSKKQFCEGTKKRTVENVKIMSVVKWRFIQRASSSNHLYVLFFYTTLRLTMWRW